MTKAKLLILVALGFSLLTYLRQFDLTQAWLNFEVSKNPSISFSKAGFSPKKIVVREGTEVGFINESEEGFWPASNIHPLNDLYPEFDPKKPLAKGNKWLFRFEKVGEWGYHDHLNPNFSGTVIVIGKRLFNKKDTSCQDPASLTYNQRQVCWYFEMKDIIQKEGLTSAFARLLELFEKEPAFASGCHDVTHLIGDAAYREFEKGKAFIFREETSWCGYGFYHGFIESLLWAKGDLKEAQKFCESINQNLTSAIKSPNAIYSCYHGMGHSTFDAHDPRLWGNEIKMLTPAITLCEKVREGLEEEKSKQCATGVFNALANAYSNNQYGLKLNEKDPVWICRDYASQYKKACFAEVAVAWVSTTMGGRGFDFLKAARFIEGLKDKEGEEMAIFALSSEYARQRRDNLVFKDMVENCHLVKGELRPFCIQGVVVGLMGWTRPGEEYIAILDFCRTETLSQEEKNACLGYFLPRVGTLYSLDKTASICQAVEEEYRGICR